MNWNNQYAFELLQLHLIESTIVGLSIMLLVSIFRLKSAPLRFKANNLILLKFLIPIGTLLSIWNLNTTPIETSVSTHLMKWVSASTEFTNTQTGLSLWQIGLYIWASGTFLFVAKCTLAWIISQSSRDNTVTGLHSKRINQVLQNLGCGNHIDMIHIDDRTPTPISLTGIFRPRIVINSAFYNALSDSELRSALRHELEHLERKDNLWRLLQLFVVSIFWYHPLIWYAHFHSCFESERACDEAAMNGGADRKEYASCLIKATRFLRKNDRIWAPAFTGNPLKKRIQEIVNFENKKDSKMKSLTIWALIATIITGSSLLAADYQSTISLSNSTKDKIYNISEVNPKPKAIHQISPHYPQDLLKAKVNGWVDIEWVINNLGQTVNHKATKSSNPAFEQSALDAIAQAEWLPGEVDGKAVSVRVRQRISYKL